ncbi:MAG: aldolase [Alsobacter sp.]
MTPPGADHASAVHASAVVVGEAGLLIRGASGTGKSTLAREILALAAARGLFARLLGDDRILLSEEHGRLVARPHAAIAGTIEVRGLGLVPVDHAPSAVVRLLVDCGEPRLDRLPGPDQLYETVSGVLLRRIVAGPGDAERVLFALEHPAAPSGAMEPK